MKNLMIVLLAIFLISTSLKSTPQAEVKRMYDYVTITQLSAKSLHICVNGEKYDEIKINAKGSLDFNETIKLVKQYENEGYELVTSNLSFQSASGGLGSGTAYNYFLLQREHKK